MGDTIPLQTFKCEELDMFAEYIFPGDIARISAAYTHDEVS